MFRTPPPVVSALFLSGVLLAGSSCDSAESPASPFQPSPLATAPAGGAQPRPARPGGEFGEFARLAPPADGFNAYSARIGYVDGEVTITFLPVDMPRMPDVAREYRSRAVTVRHCPVEPHHVGQECGPPVFEDAFAFLGQPSRTFTLPECGGWLVVEVAELSADRYNGWRSAPLSCRTDGQGRTVASVDTDGNGDGWENSRFDPPPRASDSEPEPEPEPELEPAPGTGTSGTGTPETAPPGTGTPDRVQSIVNKAVAASGGLAPGRDAVPVANVGDLFRGTSGTARSDFSATSSDPAVATVLITHNPSVNAVVLLAYADAPGSELPHVEITPVGPGEATIEVVFLEVGASQSFDVTVEEPPSASGTPEPAPGPGTPGSATPEPEAPEPAAPEPEAPGPAPEPGTPEPGTPGPGTPGPVPEPETPEPAPEPGTPGPGTPGPVPEPETPEPAPEPGTPGPGTPGPVPEPETPEPAPEPEPAAPPPSIVDPGDKTYDRGQTITPFRIAVRGPGGEVAVATELILAVEGLPAGLRWSSETRFVSGTVATDARVGDHQVTVTARDALNVTEVVFVITVNQAPDPQPDPSGPDRTPIPPAPPFPSPVPDAGEVDLPSWPLDRKFQEDELGRLYVRGVTKFTHPPGDRCADQQFDGWTGCTGADAALESAWEQVSPSLRAAQLGTSEAQQELFARACAPRKFVWGQFNAYKGGAPWVRSIHFEQTLERPVTGRDGPQFWRYRYLYRVGWIALCDPLSSVGGTAFSPWGPPGEASVAVRNSRRARINAFNEAVFSAVYAFDDTPPAGFSDTESYWLSRSRAGEACRERGFRDVDRATFYSERYDTRSCGGVVGHHGLRPNPSDADGFCTDATLPRNGPPGCTTCGPFRARATVVWRASCTSD